MAGGLFESKYSEVLDRCKSRGTEVIQAHFGEMSKDDVNSFAYELEAKLKEAGEKKGIVKRIFSLIIEALQNIRLHGERLPDNNQPTFFVIGHDDDEYIIVTANLIRDDVIPKVQGRIDTINKLDRAGLKELYMDTLTDGKRSSKGGAGLGFITVAMKAKNKIDYKFIPAGDNTSLFEMEARVKKKKEE